MSGTQETFNLTKEDVRKIQERESRANDGDIPAGSDAAGLQVGLLPTITCDTR